MSSVTFSNVEKRYGKTMALQGFDLNVGDGELVTLLGPSGCGKTTALRILAGLVLPSAGSVTISGSDVTKLPTVKRNIGMVFQSYSLFPNLSARANMEFGLRARSVPGKTIKDRVDALLEITGLAEHQYKFPHQLSGGQQQRVALVRALVTQPGVLLLDEPLSALDAQVRVQIRDEVRRLQRELGITTIFVTHDQEEAMSISDRVGVMQDGRLLQLAAPQELYDRPEHGFVARFFGTMNEVLCRRIPSNRVVLWGQEFRVSVASPSLNTRNALALIRPESVRFAVNGQGIRAIVNSISFLGPISTVEISPSEPPFAEGPNDVRLRMSVSSAQIVGLHIGDEISFTIAPDPLFVVSAQD